MTWVRLDEGFARHPKLMASGPLSIALQVSALCYCNTYLTDGFVPAAIAASLLHLDGISTSGGEEYTWGMIADDLVKTGVWDIANGGYQIHDFQHFQPSRRDVEAERERNREAGRKGGLARASKHTAKHPAKHTAKRSASEVPSENPSETQARPRTRTPSKGSSSEDPSTATTKTVAPRQRNEHWDTLTAIFGYSPTSQSEQKEWGQHCAELRRMNLTPPELHEASRRYDAQMPNVQKTPRALVKHAQKLLATTNPPNRPLKARDLLALGDELEHLGNGATPSRSPSRIPQLESPS